MLGKEDASKDCILTVSYTANFDSRATVSMVSDRSIICDENVPTDMLIRAAVMVTAGLKCKGKSEMDSMVVLERLDWTVYYMLLKVLTMYCQYLVFVMVATL